MARNEMNLQDSFLNQVRKDNTEIQLVMLDGNRLTGLVRGFDNFTVIVNARGQQHLIYKHAIAQIISRRPQHHAEGEPAPHVGEEGVPVEGLEGDPGAPGATGAPGENPPREQQFRPREQRPRHERRDDRGQRPRQDSRPQQDRQGPNEGRPPRDQHGPREQRPGPQGAKFNTIDLSQFKVPEKEPEAPAENPDQA